MPFFKAFYKHKIGDFEAESSYAAQQAARDAWGLKEKQRKDITIIPLSQPVSPSSLPNS